MFHQRNIVWGYTILAALTALAISGAVGSVIVSLLIVTGISMPVIFVIKKIFPAPDWYKNENEKTGMTSMNISSRDE